MTIMDFSIFREYVLENTFGETVRGSMGGAKIGKVVNRKPGELDYWHRFYPPLKENEINKLEQVYSFRFPESLKAFYQTSDGLRLGGVLNIYGWGSRVDEAGQAIHLDYGNLVEQIKNKPDNMLVIGTLHLDKFDQFDEIMIDESGIIYVNNGSTEFKIRDKYENMMTFLYDCFDRHFINS